MGLFEEVQELEAKRKAYEEQSRALIAAAEAEVEAALDAEDAAINATVGALDQLEKVKKIKAPKTPKVETPAGPLWLDFTQVVPANNLVWIVGYGKQPAEVMFIGDRPNTEEFNRKTPFCGAASQRLIEICNRIGINIHSQAYCTYAVKYLSPGKKSINVADLGLCRPMLTEEIKRVKPKVIVCMGSKALAGVMGNGANFDHHHGAIAKLPDSFEMPDVKVVTTHHPAAIFRNPAALETFEKNLQTVSELLVGKVEIEDVTNYTVIRSCAELEVFAEYILSQPQAWLALDCEWHGVTWMDPTRYFRTIQLAYEEDKAIVIELTDVNGVVVMDDPVRCWAILKGLLTNPKVMIAGHNVISDGEWLLAGDKNVMPEGGEGIDIRPRVLFDTMLAEYLINELGPFGLEVVTCKYTKMGRYDLEVALWRKAHEKDPETHRGFGNIPRELLIPYGAKDVTATWRVMKAQTPILVALDTNVFDKRGPNKEYPSMWETTMDTQRNIYELERTGMSVDIPLLDSISSAYAEKLQMLENLVVELAKKHGVENFNHRSGPQKIKLLFDTLGLTPVKTTKGKAWASIQHHDEVTKALYSPAVDKTTLEILEHAHPIVKMLSNISKVDTLVKNFLKEDEDADEASKGGGIKAKVWPDGRIHTHFSQLSDTGRFRHSKPNSANWPKKAEGYMAEIFGGKDKVPPALRTMVVPPPGHVFIEGDFCQAELFVLAALSGDSNMWDALSTPGKDLHDLTAISSFKLAVKDAQGNPVSDDFCVKIATEDAHKFKEFQKGFVYVTNGGKILTRQEFKDGLRVGAKSLNFGCNSN